MATPLVNWDALVIPANCIWHPGMYQMIPPKPDAQQRAMDLLLAHLDEQQRADYLRMQRFATQGASGVVYVMGLCTYPTALMEGKPYARFCAPPSPLHFDHSARGWTMPMEDLVLTWKLHIEGDEELFRMTARATKLH